MALFPDGKTSCLPSTISDSKEVEVWYPFGRRPHWKVLENVNAYRPFIPEAAYRRESHKRETEPAPLELNDWWLGYRSGPSTWVSKVFVSWEMLWEHIRDNSRYRHRATFTIRDPGDNYKIVEVYDE